MRKSVLALSALAFPVAAFIVTPLVHAENSAATPSTQPASDWKPFGDPMKLTDADNVDAGKVLANLDQYKGKNVRIVGKVTSVCQKRGCWLRMSSEGTAMDIFVKFTCPIEGRLIPLNAVKCPVKVEGELNVSQISEEDARHEAEEAGATKEQIEAIKGPQQMIEIAGPSAMVELPKETSNAN